MFKVALVADAPSPEYPAVPLPAIVVMIPVILSTLRITLLSVSAIYKFPEESKDIPCGSFNLENKAFPRSPEYPLSPVYLIEPAILVIVPDASTLRIKLFTVSAIYKFPE